MRVVPCFRNFLNHYFYLGNMKQIILTTFVLLSFASLAHGHSIGQSLEKQVGDHTIDIGYDSFVPEIPAGEPVRFDFNLSDRNKTLRVPFTTVWVRIAPLNGQGFLFTGVLGVPEFGPTGMSYVFSSGGSYELTTRFQDKDKTLAEISFPLTVESSSEESAKTQSTRNFLMGGFIGFALGIVIAFFFRKRI